MGYYILYTKNAKRKFKLICLGKEESSHTVEHLQGEIEEGVYALMVGPTPLNVVMGVYKLKVLAT